MLMPMVASKSSREIQSPTALLPSTTARKKVFITPLGDYREQTMAMWLKHGDYIGTKKQSEADIICFLGGPDVSPIYYNEEAIDTTVVDEQHDQIDLEIYCSTKDRSQLLVGICRGGQFLNVMSGGMLWQDVDNHNNKHPMFVSTIKPTIEVTSIHHQMMIVHKTASVLGYSMRATKKQSEFLSWDLKGTNKIKIKSGAPTNAYTNMIVNTDTDPEVVWYEGNRCLCYQPHPELGSVFEREYFFSLIDKFK